MRRERRAYRESMTYAPRRGGRRRWVGSPELLVLAGLLAACPGAFEPHPGRDGAGEGSRSGDAEPPERASSDLPVKAGDPCRFGLCGSGLVCLNSLDVCVSECTAASSCDSKSSSCEPGQACLFFSAFTDACYPVTAKLLQSCQGQICEEGTLCVSTGYATKCLKLCKYSCPAGSTCVPTTSGCQVCYQ
jgi:hypothetical protein